MKASYRLQINRPFLFAMVGLLVVVSWLTLSRLNADPYWVDEVISAQRAGQVSYDFDSSPLTIWQRTADVSDQVPGYYILLGQWGNLVGVSPFAGRALSWLIGLLTLAGMYQLGTLHASRLAGFSAALLLATSAFYMLFLHEMRTYALLLCFITYALWFYALIIQNRGGWWAQGGLVVCVAGMLYSYYLSIVVVATLCLYHLLFVKKDRDWWRGVGLFALAGMLFLPWFLTSFSVLDDSTRNGLRQLFTTNSVQALAEIASAFSNQNSLFLVLLLVCALPALRAKNRMAWFVLVVSTVLMVILNPLVGVFVNLRYSLLLWVPLAWVGALGIVSLVRWGVSAKIVWSLLVISGLLSVHNDALTAEYDLPIRYLPWDHLTAFLDDYEQPDDVMVFIANIEGDDWEGNHEATVMPHYFYDSVLEAVFIEDVRNLPDAAFLQEGEQLTQDAGRVWLSFAPKLRSWRMGLFDEMLRENDFQHCGNVVNTNELSVDLYADVTQAPQGVHVFGGADDTEQAQLAPVIPLPTRVSNQFYIAHGWQLGEAVPRGAYSLAVHLYDADGQFVQQTDYGLPIDAQVCIITVIDMQDLPEGVYELRSFVYAWEDGARVPIVNAEGDAEFVSLGTIRKDLRKDP